ncbi:glycosyltransferase family 2 protein [Actinomycetes bacterium NPDC127524]
MKEVVTIFTPTYNRAYKLSNLYQSLINQTNKQFEWLVIDDGSNDNTRQLIKEFIKEDKINIVYVHKKNEGKSIAINKAAEYSKTDWIFIVDSDDTLTSDAVDVVIQFCDSVKDQPEFAGVAGLKGKSSTEVWSSFNVHQIQSDQATKNITEMVDEYIDATAIEYRFAHGISGDRAEVIRKDVLKEYPFPKIPNENFMPESLLWFALSRDGYKFRWFNNIIYLAEYLEDGLTKNGKKISLKNSKSKCYLENFFLSLSELPFRVRVKSAINYYRYGLYSGYRWKDLMQDCKDKKMSLIGIPVSFFYKVK